MKKIFLGVFIVAMAAVMFWLVGCSKDESTSSVPAGELGKSGPSVVSPNSPGNGGGGPSGGQSGTTLSDVVTANCFNYYDWSCSSSLAAPLNCFNRGDCQDITATVSVTKGAQHSGFSGTICVTNGGAVATTDLKVGAILMRHASGGFTATTCTVSGLESQHPVLDAGESFCYTYTINAAPGCLTSDNNEYRVDGDVTITNHSGSLGTPKGPNGKSDSLPLCPPSNDCINVSDVPGTPVDALDAPDGTSYSISVTSTNPVNVCASGDVSFTIHICATSTMPYEESWTVDNTATVDGHDCSANTILTSCLTPSVGCSFTQGFWKTHGCVGPHGKSQYGHNANKIDPLLASGSITLGNRVISTCEQAGAVFQGAQGNQGNAIKRLYSQMLAAMLNIRNGADGSCIAQAIADANAVLSAADPNGDASGWSGISGANRSAVQAAASTFDQYNNGLLCVPHCE